MVYFEVYSFGSLVGTIDTMYQCLMLFTKWSLTNTVHEKAFLGLLDKTLIFGSQCHNSNCFPYLYVRNIFQWYWTTWTIYYCMEIWLCRILHKWALFNINQFFVSPSVNVWFAHWLTVELDMTKRTFTNCHSLTAHSLLSCSSH